MRTVKNGGGPGRRLVKALAWAAAVFMSAGLFACGERGPAFTLEAGSTGEDDLPVECQRLDELAKAFDGDPATRWTTGVPMRPWFYIAIHLKSARKVRAVVLDAKGSPKDYPRGFVAEVSRGGKGVREVARGRGKATRDGVTRIDLEPGEPVDLILITLTKPSKFFWSIHELTLEYAD
jgi:hypothetical protein